MIILCSTISPSMYLVSLYVDNIVITSSDKKIIAQLKQYLAQKFHTKDVSYLRYFLDIEEVQSKDGLVISPKKLCS